MANDHTDLFVANLYQGARGSIPLATVTLSPHTVVFDLKNIDGWELLLPSGENATISSEDMLVVLAGIPQLAEVIRRLKAEQEEDLQAKRRAEDQVLIDYGTELASEMVRLAWDNVYPVGRSGEDIWLEKVVIHGSNSNRKPLATIGCTTWTQVETRGAVETYLNGFMAGRGIDREEFDFVISGINR